MKKILTAALCCLMLGTVCFGFAACGEPELSGFDTDMATAFAKENNLEVEFRLIVWKQKEMELESNKCDLVWNGMTVDEERREAMELSINYLRNYQAVVIRTADAEKFKTMDDFKTNAAKLVAEEGSAGEGQFSLFEGITSRTVESQRDALLQVKSRHYDAAIVDSTMANYITNAEGSEFNDLMMIENMPLAQEDYAVAAKKGNVGLIAKVNEFFKKSSDSGMIKTTAEKYGLESLLEDSYDVPRSYDSLTAAEKKSWEDIVAKGKIIVGYTINPPIAIA